MTGVPRFMNRRCLAAGPQPVSKWRKAERHHHLAAAVDTRLSAALTGRRSRFTLSPCAQTRLPSMVRL
jgi:hypothetical protein